MHSCYNTKILVYHYFSDDGDIINILPDEDNPKWKVNIIVSQDHMKPYVRLRTRVVSSTPRQSRVQTHNVSGDCIGSYKSNCQTITTRKTPYLLMRLFHLQEHFFITDGCFTRGGLKQYINC
jgi:hypothetical protein